MLLTLRILNITKIKDVLPHVNLIHCHRHRHNNDRLPYLNLIHGLITMTMIMTISMTMRIVCEIYRLISV